MTARTASRLAWAAVALFAALVASGLALLARNGRGGLGGNLAMVVVFGSIVGVGALVVSHQPGNPIGWLFLFIGTGAALSFASGEYEFLAYVADPAPPPGRAIAAWVSGWAWVVSIGPIMTYVPLLFPDGRLPSPRWRPVAWAAGALLLVSALLFAVAERLEITDGVRVPNPFGLVDLPVASIDQATFLAFVAVALPSVAALIVRFRRSTGEERLRLKWFTFGIGVLAGFFLFSAAVQLLGLGDEVLGGDLIAAAAFMAVPVGAGIGILRYQLFDIDLVIRKTVVFGLLAAFITIVYGVVVLGIPALVLGVRPTGMGALPLVAAVVLAIAFQPVRRRAQHWANRLVYGERATPYEVLSEFAQRMSGTFAAEELLPRTARILNEGTGAERTDVWLRVGDELRPAASWPSGGPEPGPLRVGADGELPPIPGADAAYPVRHQDELLGAVSIRKPRDEPITDTEDRLLAHVAAQAGLVLRNARLTEELRRTIDELRASRQRLVTAQDEERRRLERNIHDGAQQQLVALTVQLRLLEERIGRDPEGAREAASQLRGAAAEALEDLRDLARGIYPPLLADKGLPAAIEAQARRSNTPIDVEADGVARHPPQTEAAVYFCCLEAIQNATKHAGAARIVVRISEGDGELRFEVEDDGRGFEPAAIPRGTGLQNMSDRLEALGGTLEIRSVPGRGTTIRGRLPTDGGRAG
ncbi:MAG TPA: histidine kinase [Actinomycetota bacterium]|nr:histidine kinase [Actinomycetota bacterium]